MSTDSFADATKALVAGIVKAPCYDHDESRALGSALPARYVVLYLHRRFGGNVRGDTRGSDLRRLQTRVAAKSVSDARLMEDRLSEAFEHATHTVDGALVHFAYESGGGNYDLDGGYYTDLTDWTFTV